MYFWFCGHEFALSFLKYLAESQKGVNAVQQCSVENQNGANAVDFVQQ